MRGYICHINRVKAKGREKGFVMLLLCVVCTLRVAGEGRGYGQRLECVGELLVLVMVMMMEVMVH